MAKKTKVKRPATKPAAAPSKGEAYKAHRAGSSAGRLHKLFDATYAAKGVNPTRKLAAKLGIKAPTLRVWIATWRRELEGVTERPKRATKAAAPVAPKRRAAKKTKTAGRAKLGRKPAGRPKLERRTDESVSDTPKGKVSARKAA